MLTTSFKKVNKLNIGDKVIIDKVSNASLNLYMKAKQNGLIYIKCPCNANHTSVFEIQKTFFNGFLLVGSNRLMTVAYSSDLRKIG